MFFKKIFFGALLIFIGSAVNSQSLEGKIVNSQSTAIRGATVHILNTYLSSASDAQGNFIIENLLPGTYQVTISSEGYAAKNLEVTINRQATTITVQLTPNTIELDEVIVTAEKREASLQKIPISITTLSARQVQDEGLWSTGDITAIVPNLYAGNPGDGRNVTSVRGITSTSYDPAVTTYVDGVNQFTLDTYIPQLFDVERIEVLRGPQGTLYGRNAMGGVINIITKQPTNKIDGFAEISVGHYGQQRVSAGIRTPVIKDKLFFGASGLYEGLNGYFFNQYTNSEFDKQHSAGGNYYLKYLPGSKWGITFNVKHFDNRNFGSFPLAPSADDAFAHPFQLNQDAVAELVDKTLNTSLSVNYSGRHFNFSSQTAYQSNYRYYATPIDGDFSPIDGITVINNYGHKWNNVKVVTQEFKLSSPASSSSALKWTAGTYLFSQNAPNRQGTHFGKDAELVTGDPATDYAIINTTKLNAAGVALYTQETYTVNKKIDIIGGLRYDYQHMKENVLGEYLPDGAPAPVFETRSDTAATASYSAFSPMLSFAWHPVSNTNLYLTYSRGFRTGGLTQLAADPSLPPLYAYKPEYSNNFEIGAKNTLFNNRLRLNLSLFYTTITNAQIPTLILPDAITVTKNAGKLDSKGIDVEIAATPLKGLETTYNFGYTNAKYTTLKLSQNGVQTDLAGKRQIFTPDVTSMLALQYGLPINHSQTIKIVMRGEWKYFGETYFNLNNSIRQSPYSLINTRIGLAFQHIQLMLWARNVTNKKYISYAYDFGAVHLGNPQTYGITLRANL